MNDIFREVDEALQQDKALQFWHDHHKTILGAIGVMILSAALTTMYQNWSLSRNQAQTAPLVTALGAEQPDLALSKIQETLRGNHAALATFDLAGLAAQDGAYDKAATLYRSIFTDGSTSRDITDLARILYIRASLQSGQTDGEEIDGFLNLLSDIADNGKSPWHLQAKFDSAIIFMHFKNDAAASLTLLQEIAEDTAKNHLSLVQKAKDLIPLYESRRENALKKQG